jgi:hypothetical protein
MARPKNARATARLNLIVEPQTKRIAFKLAFQRRISAGRLFEELIVAEKQRLQELQQPEGAA